MITNSVIQILTYEPSVDELVVVLTMFVITKMIKKYIKHFYSCDCHAKFEPSSETHLLPIMEPLFNVREMCKQCVLLEQHLEDPRKRCGDCIRKHFMTIEGLAEEALGLDTQQRHTDILKALPNEVRRFEKMWIGGVNCANVAQHVRAMRKRLMPHCFKMFWINCFFYGIETCAQSSLTLLRYSEVGGSNPN